MHQFIPVVHVLQVLQSQLYGIITFFILKGTGNCLCLVTKAFIFGWILLAAGWWVFFVWSDLGANKWFFFCIICRFLISFFSKLAECPGTLAIWREGWIWVPSAMQILAPKHLKHLSGVSIYLMHSENCLLSGLFFSMKHDLSYNSLNVLGNCFNFRTTKIINHSQNSAFQKFS